MHNWTVPVLSSPSCGEILVDIHSDTEKSSAETGRDARNDLSLGGATGVQVGSGNIQVNNFYSDPRVATDPEGRAGKAENPGKDDTVRGDDHQYLRNDKFIDLYQKAVDHLASEKAHTRMAALQAIGELGQDHPSRRQALTDVICGYLRLPQADADRDEVQVRSVAQEVLRSRLHPDRDEHGQPRNQNFWPKVNVNLKGAHLLEANFAYCEFGWTNFDEAHFTGTTWFTRCIFSEEARFVGTVFDGWRVSFEEALFEKMAWHRWTAFNACAEFRGAHFAINAEFSRSRFSENVDFTDLIVRQTGWFTHNVFSKAVDFRGSVFGSANFIEVAFEGPVDFRSTTFIDGTGREQVFVAERLRLRPLAIGPKDGYEPNR